MNKTLILFLIFILMLIYSSKISDNIEYKGYIVLLICGYLLFRYFHKNKDIIEKFPYYRPIHYNQIGGYVPNIVIPPSFNYYRPYFYYNPYNKIGSYCRRYPYSCLI